MSVTWANMAGDPNGGWIQRTMILRSGGLRKLLTVDRAVQVGMEAREQGSQTGKEGYVKEVVGRQGQVKREVAVKPGRTEGKKAVEQQKMAIRPR